MKNISVKLRLVFSFLFIAVITFIVGLVSIVGMLELNSNQDQMYTLSVNNNYVNYMVENLQNQRITFRNAVLHMEDTQKLGDAVARLNELDAEYKEIFSFLSGKLLTEKSRTYLTDIGNAHDAKYVVLRNQLMEAALSGEKDLTYRLMDAIAEPVGVMIGTSKELVAFAEQYISDVSDADQKAAYMRITIVAVLAVAAVTVAVLLGFYIAGQITLPLSKIKTVMNQVGGTGSLSFSKEDMDELEEDAKTKDEIGQCIASFVKMIHHFEGASGVLQQVAEGDLTVEFRNLSEADTLGVSINQMLDNLNSIFSEIRVSASQVSSGAEQVSQGAQELAAGSSEQAAGIQEFSATLAEILDRTNHNAENSNLARDANHMAAVKLEESIHSMGEMLNAMSAIDESAGNITKVIKVIDDIAFQTNILALNAAVEAARAGMHGKGFAVVADEVRNLAAKSAEAAKETAVLIEGSSERVGEGNQIVAKTNIDLKEVVEMASECTQLISQVSEESGDQARAIAEISRGIEQISSVVQANSATSEQSAAASQEMSAQAEMLESLVSRFKLRQSKPDTRVTKVANVKSIETGFSYSA